MGPHPSPSRISITRQNHNLARWFNAKAALYGKRDLDIRQRNPDSFAARASGRMQCPQHGDSPQLARKGQNEAAQTTVDVQTDALLERQPANLLNGVDGPVGVARGGGHDLYKDYRLGGRKGSSAECLDPQMLSRLNRGWGRSQSGSQARCPSKERTVS